MKHFSLSLIICLFFQISLNAQTFTNVISSSGINPINANVKDVFDYDNDGLEDLLIYNNNTVGWRLYKNNGSLSFSDVSTSLGLPVLTNINQGIAVDLNNNGYMDLVFVQQNNLRVFLNTGGAFIEKTQDLGIINPFFATIPGKLMLTDIDKDGDLDFLFLKNGSTISVLINNVECAGGTLNQVVNKITNTVSGTNFEQIVLIDYDNDQDEDVVILRGNSSYPWPGGFYFYKPILLFNNNNGIFTQVTTPTGLINSSVAGFATVWDYNNDGWLDLLIGVDDYSNKPLACRVFKNNGNGTFTDMSSTIVLRNANYYYHMGSTPDFDNDGDFDVYWFIVGFGATGGGQLYQNNNGSFVQNAAAYGLNIVIGPDGNGALFTPNPTWFDADNDGDLDMFGSSDVWSSYNKPAVFMKSAMTTNNNRYLRIKLQGCQAPRDAKGSRIVLFTAGKKLTQYYTLPTASSSYASGGSGNSSKIIHYGLGSALTADSVKVYWTSGNITTLYNVNSNQTLTIVEDNNCSYGNSNQILSIGAISGSTSVFQNTTGEMYSIAPVYGATNYTWSVPADALIISGQGTETITVDFGTLSGNVEVYASNACGNSDNVVLAIDVQANPVVLNVPVDFTASACSSQFDIDAEFASWIASATFTGGCNTSFSNDATSAPDHCGGSVTVTWTVTSTCEPDVILSSTFTVTADNSPPSFTRPADITIYTDGNCDFDTSSLITGDVTDEADDCSSALDAIFSDIVVPGPYPGSFDVIRTWSLSDNCGNAASYQIQTILVRDNTPPSIICPADITRNYGTDENNNYSSSICGATVNIPDPIIDDNCGIEELVWSMSGASSGSSAPAGLNNIGQFTFNHGVTTIVYTVKDAAGYISNCSFIVTIDKAPALASVVVVPSSQQYSDKVTFTSTITDGASICGQQAAQSATFFVGAQNMGTVNFVVQGDDLIAILSDVALLEDPNPNGEMSPGMKTVTAVLNGINSTHFDVPASLTTALTITKENAAVEYNGTEYFTTSCSTCGTATIHLSSSVIDDADGSRGDIRNAKVGFFDGESSNLIAGTTVTNVGLVNPGNIHEGIAVSNSFTVTVSTNNNSSGGTILSVLPKLVDPGYYTGQAPDVTVLTVALPGNDFITGGGHIITTNSAGTYAATVGTKMNFGFVMKWNKKGTNAQGNVNIIFRRWEFYQGVWQWRIYQIKSNSINSFGTVTQYPYKKAIILTKASLRDITDPLNIISLGGNLNLTVNAWENNTITTGADDRISVQLTQSNGGLLFSSHWTGVATQVKILNGGKIQVHNDGPQSVKLQNSLTDSEAVQENILFTNYPNPFTGATTVTLKLQNDEHVSISVYNNLGQLIKNIYEGDLKAGFYEYLFDGSELPGGVYFCTLQSEKFNKSIKIVLTQ